MSRLALASTTVPIRQVLAQGRFYESITNRGMAGFHATLGYSHAGGEGIFRTAQTILPEGYFALHLDPGNTMPNLSQVDSVTLILTLIRASAAPVIAQVNVDGADLSLEEQEHTVNNQLVRVHRISGAPFVFDMPVEPKPILLDGLLLRNSNPEEPAGDVEVSVLGITETVVTNPEGRFRITTLPISETVTLQFDDNGTVYKRTLRPAWGNGSMTQTFSLPSS